MRKFLAKMFLGIALLASPMSAYADVCFTPSQFKANIEMMEKAGNFDATIYEYTGTDAEAIRAFAAHETDVDLSEVLEFDTVIMAVHPEDPRVFNLMFKDGCKVGGGVINKETLKKMQMFLEGV